MFDLDPLGGVLDHLMGLALARGGLGFLLKLTAYMLPTNELFKCIFFTIVCTLITIQATTLGLHELIRAHKTKLFDTVKIFRALKGVE